MRFGEKCKEKTTKMTEDSPRVTDLINNANFLLNVSVFSNFQGVFAVQSLDFNATDSSGQPFPRTFSIQSRSTC